VLAASLRAAEKKGVGNSVLGEGALQIRDDARLTAYVCEGFHEAIARSAGAR